jgi:hypothetical protein
MFNDVIFWKDGFNGQAKGGIFMELVEESETGGEVVGLRFDDNNLEIIVKNE